MFQACNPCVLLTPSVIQDHIVVLSSRDYPYRHGWRFFMRRFLFLFFGGREVCINVYFIMVFWVYNIVYGFSTTSCLTPQHVNVSPNIIIIFMKTVGFQSSMVFFLQTKVVGNMFLYSCPKLKYN